jgi:L-threonylcarbamoyladenylate synthase
MKIVAVDPQLIDPQAITAAAETLRRGGLVAFPTETVYGLGANALDPRAVDRIYAAKGRPSYNPLIVHVARAEGALDVVSAWPDTAARLAATFWPGPLTLVLPKRAIVPDGVTAGLATVAVRVPRHPIAHALLDAVRLPIAAPSANKSTQVSPTRAEHVAKSLGDAVDLILDGGPTEVGIESTVIDLSGERPVLLRPGMISTVALERIVGPVDIATPGGGETARRSPGMMDKHYAPRARVVLVESGDVGIRVEHERANVRRVGALVIGSDVTPAGTIIRMPGDAPAYAADLYGALHRLDDAGCDVIVIERVPAGAEWMGVADRLRRAETR